jgi:ribonuclease HI
VGQEFKDTIKFSFKTTNNEAEYEAVIAGSAIALELKAGHVKVRSDSSIAVRHVLEEYEAKEERMQKYLKKTKELVAMCIYLFTSS